MQSGVVAVLLLFSVLFPLSLSFRCGFLHDVAKLTGPYRDMLLIGFLKALLDRPLGLLAKG